MRIGINPFKDEQKLNMSTYHRIVVVVYIPNEEGFYKNAITVLKSCLESLFETINRHAAITVVNNGSFKKVGDLLNFYSEQNKIDALITHSYNIGKIDAQIGAARASREEIITLTDSDILFCNGWQENVEEIFSTFPNVGSVSPIPVRTGMYAGTSSVLKQILLRKLKFRFIALPENMKDYNRFLSSINWDLDIDTNKKWPVVENKGVKAIIGSAHQVLTIDRNILFMTTPSNPSLTLVGSNSEHNYIDVPIDKAGKLRLATYKNFAYHIGNEMEEWMTDIIINNSSNKKTQQFELKTSILKDVFNSKFEGKVYSLRKMIIKKIFALVYGKVY